jgi:hypothetical protein
VSVGAPKGYEGTILEPAEEHAIVILEELREF